MPAQLFARLGAVLFAVLAASLLAGVAGCSRQEQPAPNGSGATVDSPFQSPSGSYTLQVHEEPGDGAPNQFFTISDASGSVVYTAAERFSQRHRTYFVWGDNDTVWVYSGDVGTYVWQPTADPAVWTSQSYRESGLPAPQVLKDLRPNYYDN